MPAPRCSPPKSQAVKSYWRAAPRKRRRLFKPGETYYVAESAKGHTCGHTHKTRTAAMKCAARLNRKETRAHGRSGATFISEPRKAR